MKIKMPSPLLPFLCFFLTFLLTGAIPASVAAENRGISKRLKIKDTSGKQVAEYQGSYALLIGESSYNNGWSVLNSVPSEISRVESLLKKQGFAVTTLSDLNSRELKYAFDDFVNKYGYIRNNRLLFFYSGHGYSRKNGNKGYLVPVDAPNPNKDERAFLQKALSMNNILSWARNMEAKHVLFLFDSCFSGTIFKSKSLPRVPPHISRLTAQPVRLFISAGAAGEEVPAKSTFAQVFIDGLEYGNADLNRDGYVCGMELGMYLQEKVPQHANQNPQFGKIRDYDLSRGDFVFLAGGSPEVEQKALQAVHSTTGRLQIESSPSGAKVFIDGNVAGETPVALSDMVPGNKQVRVEKSGYIAEEKSVRVRAGARKVIRLDLSQEQRKSWLTVSANPTDATVRILNINPRYSAGMELTAGRYHVEVSAVGYQRKQQWIELGAGDDLDVDISLQRERDQRVSDPASRPQSSGSVQNYTDPVTGMEFVWVKGGCYRMGDTFGEGSSDEKPVHEVCVDGFYMGRYEVTQGQYQEITGSNPSRFKKGNSYPVEKVSWNDAWDFISKLNSRSGKRYRLPTEAEWEYAAREQGKDVRFGTGKDTIGPDEANFDARARDKEFYSRSGTYREQTAAVGSFSPNSLGLYDMSGNVWEWCSDWYDKSYYKISPRNNPQGASSVSTRVVRGGSWRFDPDSLRAASRSWRPSGGVSPFLGFRLVLSEDSS